MLQNTFQKNGHRKNCWKAITVTIILKHKTEQNTAEDNKYR